MTKKCVLMTVVCCVVFTVAGSAVSWARKPTPRYKLTFLPSLGGFRTSPHSVNDHGQVVGAAETTTRTLQIFLWDKQEGVRVLGSFSEPPHVGRLYINNAGHIAGTLTDPNGHHRAFLWDLNAGKHMLGTLGGLHTAAADLNDKGQIVGYSNTPAHYRHAFLWDPNDGMRDLGTLGGDQSVALSVNDAGQVVGFSETAQRRPRLVLWDPQDGMVDLGPAGVGPYQCRINNRGFVIRRLGTVTGKTYFGTWTKKTGLRDLDFIAIDSGQPCGLNDADQFLIWGKPAQIKLFGRVLHTRQECYLWDPNEGAVLLQDHLSVKDIVHFKVTDMNNAGWIIGQLRTKDVNQLRAIVLEPTAERRARSGAQ